MSKCSHISFYVISILSFAISIMAFICIFRWNNIHDIEGDYIGLIIGALSILVAILIGWNIYTVIDTKSIIKKVKEDADKRAEDADKRADNTEDYIFDVKEYINKLMNATSEEIKNLNNMNQQVQNLKISMLVGNLKIYYKLEDYAKTLIYTINTISLMMNDCATYLTNKNLQELRDILYDIIFDKESQIRGIIYTNKNSILKKIKEIKENKNYYYISILFDDLFKTIETKIEFEKE